MRGASIVFFACALLFGAPAPAQFATNVVSYAPGDVSAGGIFLTTNVLGGPAGGGAPSGSIDVLTLGRGGSVTLGFGVTLRDGPGVDLTIFENGFFTVTANPVDVFSEVVYVEVSTNGLDYARFPSRYAGPPGLQPAFGGLPLGTYDGLAGGTPIFSNIVTNTIDPFDPTQSGGESFDLADLVGNPHVVSGAVDLASLNFVRLVDVDAGQDVDSLGNPVRDNGGPGSADIDAVAVINHSGNVAAGQPEVRTFFDPAGFHVFELSDPDGLGHLDAPTFRMTFNLIDLDGGTLGQLYGVTSVTATKVVVTSVIPFQGFGFKGVFAVSIRDQSGAFSADQAVLQG